MEIIDNKIETFETIMKSHKNHMVHINILYTMSCHKNYAKLNNIQKNDLMNFIYDIYLEDESRTDIGFISDTVMDNYKKALNGKIDKYNIYDYL